MISSQLLAYVAILVFCTFQAHSLETFIAAVYEHAVILPNATLTPVSREEALPLMNRNLDLLEGAITSAAKQVPSLSVLDSMCAKGGVLGDRITVSVNTPWDNICVREGKN